MPRKPTVIDWKTVNMLLEAGCEGTEIAGYLGIHYNTLYERCKKENKSEFSEYAKIYRSKGDALLRSAQFKQALNGNTQMLIWLGRQRLNQFEQIQQTGELTINIIEDDE